MKLGAEPVALPDDRRDFAAMNDVRHRRRRRDASFERSDRCWIRAQSRRRAEPPECKLDRTDVAIGKIDNRELHSTPFVLGSASPSPRIASRNAHPAALKQASVIW